MTSQSPLKKYTTYLVYAGVGLGVLSTLVQFFSHSAERTYMHPLWFIFLLFIIGVQWLVFAFVAKFAQHKTTTMLKQYQIAKFAKLFIYMITLALYVFTIRTNAMAFLLNFIVYYLVFTVLETWFIQRWMNTLPPTPDK